MSSTPVHRAYRTDCKTSSRSLQQMKAEQNWCSQVVAACGGDGRAGQESALVQRCRQGGGSCTMPKSST